MRETTLEAQAEELARRLQWDEGVALILSMLKAAEERGRTEGARQGREERDELLELVRAVLQSTRDDEKGEQWTIRAFLEQRGVYDGNISGSRRLVTEACQNVLDALGERAQTGRTDTYGQRKDS